MRIASGFGLLSFVNDFVDRAIGADGLSPVVRQKLLMQQLRSAGQMTPAMLAASLVVSGVLVALAWGTGSLLPIVVLSCAINLLHLRGTWLAFGKPSAGAKDGPRLVARAIIYAVSIGSMWGLELNLLPVDQSTNLHGAAIIGVSGLLCVSMMALVNYPQMLAAFTIPLIIGALGTVLRIGSTPDIWVQGLLVIAFASIMMMIAFNHASAFVAHRASETLIKEKREIIGLLLRDFEQTNSDWIWGFDADGCVNRISGGFTSATGVPEEAMIGADFVHFLSCITPPG